MNDFPHLFDGRYEYLLREVLVSIDDAVLVFTDNYQIEYANQAAEDVFGGSKDKLIGRTITSLIPKDQQKVFRSLVSKLKSSVSNAIQLQGKREFIGLCDKTHFYAEGKLAKFKNESAYILILRDITWKKTLEEELESVLGHVRHIGSKVVYRVKNPSIMKMFPLD